jgi:hypothetical protein
MPIQEAAPSKERRLLGGVSERADAKAGESDLSAISILRVS